MRVREFEGVDIEVWVKGEGEPRYVLPEENGCLGRFKVGEILLVSALTGVEGGPPYEFFMVDKNKDISTMGYNIAGEAKNIKAYSCKVPILFSDISGVSCTKYPSNHFRFLEIFGTELNIWTVSVISQDGDFFLWQEESFSGRCYNSDGRIDCPTLSWPQMIKFLNERYEAASFPSIEEYRKTLEMPVIKSAPLEPGTGRVLWYNASQVYGCIETPEGNARVHWDEIPKRDGLCYLEAGEIVSYRELAPSVDTTSNKTSFKWDVKGVDFPAAT